MKRLFTLENLNISLLTVGLIFGAFMLGHQYGESKGREDTWEEYQKGLYSAWPTAGTISITQTDFEDPCLWFYTGKDWWSPMERCQESEAPLP
jgi:hypothetical protein